jgi:Nitrile hydratase, alpha chain
MSLFDQRMVLERELIQKALKDADFHKALLANPKSALESEFGVTLPDALQISVHQEHPNHLHVVLPTGATGTDELTMNDLTATSGWTPWINVTECLLECTQCSNNDTSCGPSDSEDE